MPTVTLLEKVYGSFSPEALEPVLKPLFQDLNVHVKIKDRAIQEWVQVEVSGEDEAVALQLLDKEFGLTPTHVDKVGKFSLLRGRIIGYSRTLDELRVDVGVFTPKVVYANVSLERLQAQLADGKKLSLQSLIELYCLYDNLPLQIKVVDAELTSEKEALEAELSEQQLSLFTSWLRVSLDRLMIVGARLQDVDRAVKASKHFRDVAKIESLGLLEHAIVCKLGTDAVGLIPAIGRYLRKATFAPFSPRKILQIINRLVL
jgi:hypothetical protein